MNLVSLYANLLFPLLNPNGPPASTKAGIHVSANQIKPPSASISNRWVFQNASLSHKAAQTGTLLYTSP